LHNLLHDFVPSKQRAIGLELEARKIPQSGPALAAATLTQQHAAILTDNDRGLA
jgi:hypothetical protein